MSLSMLGEGALKKCARCEEEKPFDQFAKHKRARDGLQAYCRKCNTQAKRESVARHSGLPDCDCRTCVKRGLAALALKRCSGCAEIKSYEAFHISRASKDGRHTMCIVCDLTRQRESAQIREQRAHGDSCPCECCTSGVKECAWCGEIKARDQFSMLRASRDGLQQHCRKCQSKQRRFRLYGIDEDDFQAMLERQGGQCATCNRDFTEDLVPHIDHDHRCCPDKSRTCGKCTRKLLCKPCNTALGQIQDNPATAMALATYLLEFQDVLVMAEMGIGQ